jgi:transcriptional regulator with XRE-family HTH domain
MRYGGDRQTLYTDIGERIMLARRRLGLSQRDFGKRLGVSHASVSYLERGKSKPDLDNLAVIADALGVPLSQIVVLE